MFASLGGLNLLKKPVRTYTFPCVSWGGGRAIRCEVVCSVPPAASCRPTSKEPAARESLAIDASAIWLFEGAIGDPFRMSRRHALSKRRDFFHAPSTWARISRHSLLRQRARVADSRSSSFPSVFALAKVITSDPAQSLVGGVSSPRSCTCLPQTADSSTLFVLPVIVLASPQRLTLPLHGDLDRCSDRSRRTRRGARRDPTSNMCYPCSPTAIATYHL